MSVIRRYRGAVDALTVRRWSSELNAWARSVVAYTASCECGWSSRRHYTLAAARAELRWHQGEHENV